MKKNMQNTKNWCRELYLCDKISDSVQSDGLAAAGATATATTLWPVLKTFVQKLKLEI